MLGRNQLPAPSEEKALEFVTELMRGQQNIGHQYYDVHLPTLIGLYVSQRIPPAPGVGIDQNLIEAIAGPFVSATWTLCRFGVLRPGPNQLDSFGQFRGEATGYCYTEFGRRWLKETPPILPTFPNKLTDLLLGFGKQFGDAYRLRCNDAVLAHNGLAYYACCAMVGAAAEAILLTAAVKKLGEDKATKLYFNKNGRSNLLKSLLGQQRDSLRNDFMRHTELITYWRDQSSHGHQTGISENEAYVALSGLLRFAHFAADHWDELTT
jgi:hypothetical protein